MTTHRVVHISSVHPPYDPRIFQKECRSLAEAGFEVSYVVPHDRAETRDGIRILPITPGQGRFQRMITTARLAIDTAARKKADLYHLHDPELLPWAGRLARGGSVVVYDMHEDLPRQVRDKPWIRPWLRRPLAAAIARSERLLLRGRAVVLAEKSYARSRPWLDRSVEVLNFPRLDWLAELEKPAEPDGPFKVGYMGLVNPERGSLQILEALGRLKRQGQEVAFECVGAAPPGRQDHLQELRDRARELGLAHVSYHGYLEPREGWRRMAGCQAGLAVLQPLPNFLASYPTKMFEYMGLGIPAIVSDFPLYREVVARFDCGVAVDPRDTAAVAGAIAALAADPQQARAMGRRGQQGALAHYNWQTEADRLVAFYRELLPARS